MPRDPLECFFAFREVRLLSFALVVSSLLVFVCLARPERIRSCCDCRHTSVRCGVVRKGFVRVRGHDFDRRYRGLAESPSARLAVVGIGGIDVNEGNKTVTSGEFM